MKSGSCARNRKRRANERGGTPSADGYYRSLSPPSSLSHSLFLLHTQLDARYFRRPSSFGQFHCTVGFPPLSPFLPLCLSLPLPCRVSCHAKHASSENAPRRDTPHHYLPGEIPRALFNEAKIAREQAAPSKFRYVFSRIIITRARAREHGFIVPDAPRYIAFNYLADPISHQSSSFSVARCLREERLN